MKKAAAIIICLLLSLPAAANVNLLDLLPPNKNVRCIPPPVQDLEWDFSEGLPDDWTAGPKGVVVTQAGGGITLRSPSGERPWLEIRTTIDPLEYKQFTVVVETAVHQSFLLFHECDDSPPFPSFNKVIANCRPGMGEQTLDLDLPAPNTLDKPIRALRLYLAGRQGTAVLKKLSIEPRNRGYVSRLLRNHMKLALRKQYRDCWRIPGRGVRDVSLKLPKNATCIRFASGTLRGQEPGELALAIKTADGEVQTLLHQPFPPWDSGWQEHQVDVSPWGGRQVTIRFRVTTSERTSIRLIGTPVVLQTEARHPSVLLIVIDAQRADRFSAYGHTTLTSPHLAQLAREGILFSHAVAPASWTVPSMASTFTGFYPGKRGNNGGHGAIVPREAPTLAERFSESGYATGGFAANPLLTQTRGFLRGFDNYYTAPLKDNCPSARQISDLALSWLRAHEDEAVFCYLHYMDPHAPYRSPWPFPPSEPESGPFRTGDRDRWKDGYNGQLIQNGQMLAPEDLSRYNRLYDNGAAYTDFQIGLLLSRLRQEGLLDNMVILVTADHGEEMQDHGFWGHGTNLYQEVVNIPMILRLPRPGHEAGSVVHAPVSLVDVVPTLVELAGLEIGPDDTEGRSLLQAAPERPVYSWTRAHGPLRFSVTSPPYKYIYFNRQGIEGSPPATAQGRWLAEHGQPAELLFNLEEDPGEQHNLVGRLPEVERRLRLQMSEQLALFDVEMLEPVSSSSDLTPEAKEQLRALGYIQ